MPRLKTVFVAACLALSVSSLHILDARQARATVNTLFQAASVSKPLSALAVLRLVQDGKLALDEDVNLKLKSWKVPENEFTKMEKVTLRRLLTHSAGATVSGFPGYESTVAVPTTIQV